MASRPRVPRDPRFEARHTALYAAAEVLDDTAYGDCGASKLARAKMLGAQRHVLVLVPLPVLVLVSRLAPPWLPSRTRLE